MKEKMKWLSIVLTLCLIVSGILVVASAEGVTSMESVATNGGIQVSLDTKDGVDVYAREDEIEVILSIGNLSGVDVANVQTSIGGPVKPAQEGGSLENNLGSLGAAQLLQDNVKLNYSATAGNPYSGMDIHFVVALMVMFASAAGLGIMLITGKIRMNKTFCLLLLAGVMLIGLIPNVRAAETDEKKVEVAKNITINGHEVILTATVTWEEVETPVITRADMEAAIQEILWDYYMKDVWVQYDSSSFDDMSTLYGGFGRLDNHLSTLEDANSQDTLYTVCSNYPWVAYYETLGFPIFGYCMNAQSNNIWAYSGSTVKNEQVNDMIVRCYHGYGGEYTTTWYDEVHGGYSTDLNGRDNGYLPHEKCFDTSTELEAFIENWEENLRPGDIIHLPGHIVVYAGNGYILEAAGGKIDLENCIDTLEDDGSINAWTVEKFFFPKFWEPKSGYELSRYDPQYESRIAIVRPLNILTIDDGDGDPSNDELNLNFVYDGVDYLNWQFEFDDKVLLAHSGYTIQPSAYTRMDYPGMNIDRTVNINPYGTATKGEEITYTVAIYNESNNAAYMAAKESAGVVYNGLPITETLPAGVEFVSAGGNYTMIGDTIYWSVDVAAGECESLSYTVRVTGEIGDEIVCGGGWVGAIPSNTIVNTVGGQKLSDEAIANMIEFYEDEKVNEISAELADTEFAEYIYNVTAGLDLNIPDAQTLLDTLFTREYIYVSGGMYGVPKSSAKGYLYTLNENTADANNQIWRDMIINGFYGGTWVWSDNFDPDARRTDDPRIDYLEPGDIIVNMTLSDSNDELNEYGRVTACQVLVYLGDGNFASLDSEEGMSSMQVSDSILSCLNYDVFVALRPSQAYGDINTDDLA